eukprot:1655518-Amphidinium_carterae.1
MKWDSCGALHRATVIKGISAKHDTDRAQLPQYAQEMRILNPQEFRMPRTPVHAQEQHLTRRAYASRQPMQRTGPSIVQEL